MSKPPKTGLLKARCEEHLEDAFEKHAANRGVDTSDIVREALRDFYHRVICADYAQRNAGRPN